MLCCYLYLPTHERPYRRRSDDTSAHPLSQKGCSTPPVFVRTENHAFFSVSYLRMCA